MEKVYHIYAKKECLYNNLSEEQFNNTWETLKGMVGLMKTCLLYTSPSPRDAHESRMPSSA